MSSYFEQEKSKSVNVSESLRTVIVSGDGARTCLTERSTFVNGQKQEEPRRNEEKDDHAQPQQFKTTANNQIPTEKTPTNGCLDNVQEVYNYSTLRTSKNGIKPIHLFFVFFSICFTILVVVFVFSVFWLTRNGIRPETLSPLYIAPSEMTSHPSNSSPMMIPTTVAITSTDPPTTESSSTTTTAITRIKTSRNKDHVDIFCLHDYEEISNDTKSVKIYSTNGKDDNVGRVFKWEELPPINGSIHLEISPSEKKNIQNVKNVLIWLNSAIVNLTVDATFSLHSCHHNQTDFSFQDMIYLEKVKQLHIYQLNSCFVEKYLTHIKFPNLVELKTFGSDKKQDYRSLLIKLIARETKSIYVFDVCEGDFKDC